MNAAGLALLVARRPRPPASCRSLSSQFPLRMHLGSKLPPRQYKIAAAPRDPLAERKKGHTYEA